MQRRLASLRGRLAGSRALEDVQWGLAAGTALAAVLGLLRFLNLIPVSPFLALSVGLCVALAFPAAGVLLRRTSSRRVATFVDERLGLAERVATALALETGEIAETPLAPLVEEDALRVLDRAPAASLRRAFRPRVFRRPVAAAVAAALLAVGLFHSDPIEAAAAKPRDPAAAYREAKEKEEAARAARRILEEAKAVEENADPRQVALRQVAAEMRRQAEEMLRQSPPKAEAMARFQKMSEMVRERADLMAGVDPQKLAEWKAEGRLSKPDRDMEKLLGKILGADLKGLNESLQSLDASLKGAEGSPEWTPEMLAALKDRLESLAEEMSRNAAGMEGRQGLQKGLKALGNAEMLREIAERVGKLMETLRQQGWKPCQNANAKGLNDGSMQDFQDGESVELSDAQLQAMIDRLKELQALAELGKIASCQNCGLSGGG
jgi:hypothetical protein